MGEGGGGAGLGAGAGAEAVGVRANGPLEPRTPHAAEARGYGRTTGQSHAQNGHWGGEAEALGGHWGGPKGGKRVVMWRLCWGVQVSLWEYGVVLCACAVGGHVREALLLLTTQATHALAHSNARQRYITHTVHTVLQKEPCNTESP